MHGIRCRKAFLQKCLTLLVEYVHNVYLRRGGVERKWEPNDMSEILIDSFATYIDALEKFSKFAQAFKEHMNLLNQARGEYQKATMAGVELRTALDAGDEALRTLMAQP